jgi:hypothetical protein
MYRSIPLTLHPSSIVRGAGVLAALLASSAAVGTIDAIALHYSRQQPIASLSRAGDALRCASTRSTSAVRTAS